MMVIAMEPIKNEFPFGFDFWRYLLVLDEFRFGGEVESGHIPVVMLGEMAISLSVREMAVFIEKG
jgi:hypothetical protein